MPGKRINRLQDLRKAQGLTRKEFCARAGVSVDQIKNWESGRSPIPQKYWQQIARVFGVSQAHLLLLDEDEPNGNGGQRAAA